MTATILPAWKRYARQATTVLVVAMVLYLAFSLLVGVRPIRQLLAFTLRVPDIAVMAALPLLGWMLRAGRWHYYARRLHWKVPPGRNLLVFLASFAFTATPGKAGEVVKSALLKERYDVDVAESAGVLLVERLQDLLAVLLLAAGGLTLLPRGTTYFVVCLVLVGALAAFCLSPGIYRAVFDFIARRFPALALLARKAVALFDTGRSLLRPVPFFAGFAFALAGWALEAWTLHYILKVLGLAASWALSFSVYGLATVVGALSMLPGGLGGFEAVSVVLLRGALGATAPQAAAATFLIRAFTLWMVSLLGLGFLGLWVAVNAPEAGRSGRQDVR